MRRPRAPRRPRPAPPSPTSAPSRVVPVPCRAYHAVLAVRSHRPVPPRSRVVPPGLRPPPRILVTFCSPRTENPTLCRAHPRSWKATVRSEQKTPLFAAPTPDLGKQLSGANRTPPLLAEGRASVRSAVSSERQLTTIGIGRGVAAVMQTNRHRATHEAACRLSRTATKRAVGAVPVPCRSWHRRPTRSHPPWGQPPMAIVAKKLRCCAAWSHVLWTTRRHPDAVENVE